MNPIQLDDYFDKKMAKVTGKYSYFTELVSYIKLEWGILIICCIYTSGLCL